jgi:predicted Zn-dependent protease
VSPDAQKTWGEIIMVKRDVKTRAAGVLLALLCLWVASCAINPVTGRQELMLVSESDEMQLGRKTDAEVVKQYGIYDDQPLTAYLNGFCQQIAQVSHRPNISYQLRIVNTSVVNAFAVPGGYIYFTRGILAYLNNEAELVGVMGHELGHVAARHSAEQLSTAQLANVGLGVGMILVPELRYVSDLAQLGVGMLFLKFSRDDERQADDLGVEYASKLGYDATQMGAFFDSLARMQPASSRSGLPEWFSTHPNPVDREKEVDRKAEEWRQELSIRNPRVNREAYLKKIDGLVFGEDPREGYVEGNVFYHPVLAFQFPVPSGWKLNNTSTQVQMASPEKDAAIMFAMAAKTSPEEAVRAFVQQNRASVMESGSIKVNGLPAVRVVSQVKSQQGSLGIISYFIQKDGNVYVFHGLTAASRYRTYVSTFSGTMEGFREVRDTSKLRVEPDRVRVRTVSATGTLRRTLQGFGVREEDLEKMAVLNGMRVDDQVHAGALIKVVEKGK